jgi:uncharacterized protein YecE (DUF72 family)
MGPRIHIGTSGWSYKHWRGLFYPEKLAAAKWLGYYTGFFSTTEINGSFYRLPTQKTVAAWIEGVPEDFIFCPKMSRFLTHMKKLREPEEPLERFFSMFDPMLHKMGPVLVQLPPRLGFNPDIAGHFFSLLSGSYRDHRFSLEIRHKEWLCRESLEMMKDHGVGFVISHSAAEFPYEELITANHVYVRFHGPDALYASSYSDPFLQAYAKKIRSWVKKGHEVWVYFNNDIGGHAVRNAITLKEMV